MTLTELLVATAIMTMTLAWLVSVLIEGFNQYDHTVNQSETQLDVTLRAEQIKRDILSSLAGDRAGRTYPHVMTDEKRLILLHGSWTGIDWQTRSIAYYVADGSLFREESGTTERLLDGVTTFQVSVTADHLVSITLKVGQQTDYARRDITRTLSIKARPRGHF